MHRLCSPLMHVLGSCGLSYHAAGEDTAFAPLLPKLFKALQTASGSPADIGDEYVEKMRGRVPKVCPVLATSLR